MNPSAPPTSSGGQRLAPSTKAGYSHARFAVANLLDGHIVALVVAKVVDVDEPLYPGRDQGAQRQTVFPVDQRLVVELPERRIAVAAAIDVEFPEVR